MPKWPILIITTNIKPGAYKLLQYNACCVATGIESMRRSVLGGALPTARQASLHLFPDFDRPDDKMTLVLMTFGQFTDHDLTRTAITKMSRDQVCEWLTQHF